MKSFQARQTLIEETLIEDDGYELFVPLHKFSNEYKMIESRKFKGKGPADPDAFNELLRST